ncbi:MAG: hypothetical protein OXH79_00555, partial [Boseongicola sp.]|nr:hypothetical protein [Boseongicola sp.]
MHAIVDPKHRKRLVAAARDYPHACLRSPLYRLELRETAIGFLLELSKYKLGASLHSVFAKMQKEDGMPAKILV